MNKTDIMVIVLYAILIIAILIGVPIATIWSLNTLFPILQIPYTLETWIASFFLFAGAAGVGISNRKSA